MPDTNESLKRAADLLTLAVQRIGRGELGKARGALSAAYGNLAMVNTQEDTSMPDISNIAAYRVDTYNGIDWEPHFHGTKDDCEEEACECRDNGMRARIVADGDMRGLSESARALLARVAAAHEEYRLAVTPEQYEAAGARLTAAENAPADVESSSELDAAQRSAWAHCYGASDAMPSNPHDVLVAIVDRLVQTSGHGRRARMIAARDRLVAAIEDAKDERPSAETTLPLPPHPHVAHIHSGTEDGALWYVIDAHDRKLSGDGHATREGAESELADILKLAALPSDEYRAAVAELRSHCPAPGDYGIAVIGSGEHRYLDAVDRNAPVDESHARELRAGAFRDGASVLVDVNGDVFDAEEVTADCPGCGGYRTASDTLCSNCTLANCTGDVSTAARDIEAVRTRVAVMSPHEDLTDAEVARVIDWSRDFAADCVWQESAEDIEDMSADEIMRGAARHYDGGMSALVSDALALPSVYNDADTRSRADGVITHGVVPPLNERERYAIAAKLASDAVPEILLRADTAGTVHARAGETIREWAHDAADVLADADALTAAALVRSLNDHALATLADILREGRRAIDTNAHELVTASADARMLRKLADNYPGRGIEWDGIGAKLRDAAKLADGIAASARGHMRTNEGHYFSGGHDGIEYGMPRAE